MVGITPSLSDSPKGRVFFFLIYTEVPYGLAMVLSVTYVSVIGALVRVVESVTEA